jgi:hypothetical protein
MSSDCTCGNDGKKEKGNETGNGVQDAHGSSIMSPLSLVFRQCVVCIIAKDVGLDDFTGAGTIQ